MRTYERNGVHVDQCSDCRGIFLDRGELDRLVDAETAWHGGTRPAEKHDDDREHGDRRHESAASEHRSEHRGEHRSRSDSHSSGGLGAVVGEVLKQVSSSKSGGHGQHGGYGDQRGGYGDQRGGYGDQRGGYGQQHSTSRPRKKESFLGDLFG